MSQEQVNEQSSKELPTQTPQAVYYQPPASHDDHYTQMVKWLAITFTTLFVMAALFIFFADRILINLPFTAEKEFVRPYEQITRYFGDEETIPERQAIQSYLDGLTESIASNMNLPDDMQIEVHFLDSEATNAFATLGGHVFICRGLMETLEDENSLAMVIGHEVAHIKNRDPIVGMARGLTIQMLYSYFTGDYSGLNVSGLGGELGLSYFSREQERKADDMGIEALQAHYGHVAGYDSLFTVLLKEIREQEGSEKVNTNTKELNWFSSHPNLDERVANLGEKASRNNWIIANVRLYPEHIKDALQVMGADEVFAKDSEQLSK